MTEYSEQWAIEWLEVEGPDGIEHYDNESAAQAAHELYPTTTRVTHRTIDYGPWQVAR